MKRSLIRDNSNLTLRPWRAFCAVTLVAIGCVAWAIPVSAAVVTVPVDVGIGPAFYHGSGPAFAGTTGQLGLKISLAAIISQAMIRKNINRVPKRYRRIALGMKEFRYRPSIFIPDALIISPKIGSSSASGTTGSAGTFNNTGMFGITWRPIGLSVPLTNGPVKVKVSAGLILTYAFLYSDNPAFEPAGGMMHFIRPGIDLGPSVEIPITDNFLVSFGWSGQVYVPQIVGGMVFDLPNFDSAGLNRSLWWMGQGWIKFHVRFPYTTAI